MLKQSGLAAFFTFLFMYSATTYAWNCPNYNNFIQSVEETINKVPPAAGLSIAISNPHCKDFTYTYGYANHAAKIQMTAETQMSIASNTKPILTVLALMLLEERKSQFPKGLKTKLTEIRDIQGRFIFTSEGKLNLPDGQQLDLTDSELYRMQTGKKFACAQDAIYQCPRLDTIDFHHLLMESSGLNDFIAHQDLTRSGLPDYAQFILSKMFSSQEDPGSKDIMTDVQTLKIFGLYQIAQPDPIIPMQSHNIDAYLLAIILERVSGESLNQLLAERILTPLHLSSDSMQFITAPVSDLAARRYAYLNTEAEVEDAIKHEQLFPLVTPELARMLTPGTLQKFKRTVTYVPYAQSSRPAFDVLSVNGQGFTFGMGAGGMIAKPKAYIQFYRALATGHLLSPASQKIFNDSFITTNGSISIGYGSNVRIKQRLPGQPPISFMTHRGFILGGESYVLYDDITETAVMVATNFSGYHGDGVYNTLPAFFVKRTGYLNDKYLIKFAERSVFLYKGD